MSSITTRTLLKMKQSGTRIAMLTAYDYPSAQILAEAGLHVLLVGDSLGMVVQGNTSTIPVTLEDIIYHTRLVARALERHGINSSTPTPLLVADMPFLTYQTDERDALLAAAKIMQQGGAQAVKLEGGREMAPTVTRLVESGIPVMAHIGLTPQSVHALGGYSVQGRTVETAQRLIEDAQALEQAGAFSVVFEMVPAEVAARASQRLTIPTIGIGAGAGCDGQVLVFHDFVGFTSGYIPKHNKRYADLAAIIKQAAAAYVTDVSTGQFPTEEQTVHLSAKQREGFEKWIEEVDQH